MDPHPARKPSQHKESAPNPRTPRPTHNAFIDTHPDRSERSSHPSSMGPGFHPVVPPSLLRGSDRPDDSLFPDRELAANQDSRGAGVLVGDFPLGISVCGCPDAAVDRRGDRVPRLVARV